MNTIIMKSITIKKVLLICSIIFGILACSSKRDEPVAAIDKEQIKKEIQAREDSFAAVYNSGELRNIGYYADDAISFFQNRPLLVGKEAIVNFLRDDIESTTDKISFKTNEIFVSGTAFIASRDFMALSMSTSIFNTKLGTVLVLSCKRRAMVLRICEAASSR